MSVLKLSAILAATVFVLSGAMCQSTDSPTDPPTTGDIALLIATNRAFEALELYAFDGDISEQGVQFVNATSDYAAASCAILTDDTLSPDERYVELEFQVRDQRLAWEMAVDRVTDISPAARLAINSARDLARLYVARQADADLWTAPCLAAQSFADRWSARRPTDPVSA